LQKRRFRSLFLRLLLFAVFVISLFAPSAASAYQVISKTTSEEIITRGVVLQTISMRTNEGPLNVYILEVDLSDPYLELDTLIGEEGVIFKNMTVTEMARRAGAVAAINGDFFQMGDSGKPIGLSYQSGRLVGSPPQRDDMYGFGLTSDKSPLLELFSFNGLVSAGNGNSFPLAGVNKPEYLLMSGISSDIDALVLYNSLWGATSRGKHPDLDGVVEVVVRNDVVQQVSTDLPGTPIPPDGYVLRGHGEAAGFLENNLLPGTKVEYTCTVEPLGEELFAAVGGQALLVQDGRMPAYFTQNIAGKHARTAAGISKDGKTLYLVGVEKQSSEGNVLSIGMTQEELAGFLMSIGMWRAVNLDGGGSTTVAARHTGEFDISLINLPQGLTQRRVPNAIGLFSTAPEGELDGLAVSGPTVLLAGTKGEFSAKGYDEYYNPVTIEPRKVTWSSSPAADALRENIFAPNKGGEYTISAALGRVTGKAEVRVIGPEQLNNLMVSPSSIVLEPGQSAQLTTKVTTLYGEYFDLNPGDVKWTVDSVLGRVSEGKFIAAGRAASGEMTATFQGLRLTVPVSVKAPETEFQVDPDKVSEISLDGRIKIEIPAQSVSSPVQVRLAMEDAPVDLSEGLSLLEAVVFGTIDEQDVLLGAPYQISWPYNQDAVEGRPAILLLDGSTGEWKEQPSRVDGGTKIVTSRIWEFGSLALVDDGRPEPVFTDTMGHWALPSISSLAACGVVNGFPDGSYGPDQAVTRAQFVNMLASAMQWPVPESLPTFKDQVPDWALPAVVAAVSRGVISGYPDGTFMPNARVSRSEMAVMIDRALSLTGADEALSYAYSDQGNIPDYAKDAVARVSSAGLLQGSGGLFRPGDGATRAETAVAVNRVLNMWLAQ